MPFLEYDFPYQLITYNIRKAQDACYIMSWKIGMAPVDAWTSEQTYKSSYTSAAKISKRSHPRKLWEKWKKMHKRIYLTESEAAYPFFSSHSHAPQT